VPQWQPLIGSPRGESREISHLSIGSRFAFWNACAITAEDRQQADVLGGAEVARSGYDAEGSSSYRDSQVVNSLLRKLRPNDRPSGGSFVSERPSNGGARPLSSIRSVRPVKAGAVWGCVTLGVLLAAAVPAWPYENDCGQWLFLYLGSVSLVVVAGLWGARVSWRGRIGWAHVLAVMTIIWGLALTAHQVLPREPLFYAKTRLAWRCHDGHAAAPAPFSVAVRLVELEGAGLPR
jgi:hypothetical protein